VKVKKSEKKKTVVVRKGERHLPPSKMPPPWPSCHDAGMF